MHLVQPGIASRAQSDSCRRAMPPSAPLERCLALATRLALLSLVATPANALVLGDVQIRSYLGQPFSARIPVSATPDETLATECLRLRQHSDQDAGVHSLVAGKVTVEGALGRQWLAVRTIAMVNEPAVGFRVVVDCGNESARDFTVLLDPVPIGVAAPEPVSAKRQRPIAPALAADTSASAPVSSSASPRITPARTSDSDPAAARSRAIPLRPSRVSAPRKVPKPARVETTDAEPDAKPVESPFVLRLDTSDLDLSRSEGVTEIQRESMRRAWQADDGTAALLATNDRIQKLEAQLGAMHAAIATLPAAAPAVAQTGLPALPGVQLPRIPRSLALTFAVLLGFAAILVRRRRLSRERENAAAWEILQRTGHNPIPLDASPLTAPALPLEGTPLPAQSLPHAGKAPAIPSPVPASERKPQRKPEPKPESKPESKPPELPALNAPIEFTLPTPVVVQLKPDATPIKLPLPAGKRAAQEEYLAGRYGAAGSDATALRDPVFVVERARMHYLDDGDTLKAADLLELAVALNPEALQPWLALFAIYRREALLRQFHNLAERFQARFPSEATWPTIQQLGAEIDTGNPLYFANATEQVAASAQLCQDVTSDWLGVPLDFTGDLLAIELHERLVSSVAGEPTPQSRVAGH